MYQAIIPRGSESRRGVLYDTYPSSFAPSEGAPFRYEYASDRTKSRAAVVEGLQNDTEDLTIRTAWRLPWAAEKYIATDGRLYIIRGVREVINRDGLAITAASYELMISRVANPIGL